MRVQVKRDFKSYFLSPQKSKQALHGIFFNLQCKCAEVPISPISKSTPPIFCCPVLFEEYLNPQIRINKMVHEHTVDFHPCPSELILRIHPLIFLWTHKGFISLEYFLNFFSSLFIPPWLRKSFKFMVLRLLSNTFVSQKNWICSFLLLLPGKNPPEVFIITPQAEEITYSSRTTFSKNPFFPSRKGWGWLQSWKMTKIKPARVLVTSFDKFHNLCNLYILD